MSFQQLLDSLPIALVFLAFALGALLVSEVGFRVGRWWQNRTPGEREGPTAMIVASFLALLAFLLAVSMGMAADRFDTRRGLVLVEANALGTTYLRAGYLPEPASGQIRERLREYVPLRVVERIWQGSRARSPDRSSSRPSSGRSPRSTHHPRIGRPGPLHRVAQPGDRPA